LASASFKAALFSALAFLIRSVGFTFHSWWDDSYLINILVLSHI